MSKITLDPELRAKLNGLTEQVQLCDESGDTVGHFVPTNLYQKMVRGLLNTRWSDEEIDELDKQTGGNSLKDIWTRLERK